MSGCRGWCSGGGRVVSASLGERALARWRARRARSRRALFLPHTSSRAPICRGLLVSSSSAVGTAPTQNQVPLAPAPTHLPVPTARVLAFSYARVFRDRPNAADWMPDGATDFLVDYMRAVINGTKAPGGADLSPEAVNNIQRGARAGVIAMRQSDWQLCGGPLSAAQRPRVLGQGGAACAVERAGPTRGPRARASTPSRPLHLSPRSRLRVLVRAEPGQLWHRPAAEQPGVRQVRPRSRNRLAPSLAARSQAHARTPLAIIDRAAPSALRPAAPPLSNPHAPHPQPPRPARRWQGSDSLLANTLWRYAKVVYEDTGKCSEMNRNDTVIDLMLSYTTKLQYEQAPAAIKAAPCSVRFPGMWEKSIAKPDGSVKTVAVSGPGGAGCVCCPARPPVHGPGGRLQSETRECRPTSAGGRCMVAFQGGQHSYSCISHAPPRLSRSPFPQVNASYPKPPSFLPSPGYIWVSTGLWAPAGSMLTITLDAAWAKDLQARGKSIGFQIGSQFADISL